MIFSYLGLNLLDPKKDMNISDAVNKCTCEFGIKFRGLTNSISGIQGDFWLIKHYNYNNRPIYYNHDNSLKRDLHLYFGSINVNGRDRGWIIDHDFGWPYKSSPILFHETNDVSKCPENVGKNWQTKYKKYLSNVEATCI